MNPAASRDSGTPESTPWWRIPMVWMVIGGPAVVVVASLVTAVVAWKHIDPVIKTSDQGVLHAADDMSETRDPKDPLAPAQQARNHAASPRR